MTRGPDRLIDLLPAVYRDDDAEHGDVLRALLQIVAGEVDIVEGDVAQLYADLFIETCRSWVIPYIGDLVGNDLLYDPSRIPEAETPAELLDDLAGPSLRPHVAVRTRADVAKTISYRRRKGTLPMLEELARDVTGWAAHAVEFLELVGWAQHLEHLRPQASMFDVRSLERADRVGGAFDEATHTVDVRAIAQHDGWHHHRHVGLFLWRLGDKPLRNVRARRAGAAWQFHVSPLGNAAPLFSRTRREGDEAGLATELHVPGPIRRARFQQDLATHKALSPVPPSTDLYGTPDNPEASIDVTRNGTHVPPAQIICARLDPWPAVRPTGQVIAIDVTTGRLAVGDGFTGTSRIDVDYVYGFPADLGGGPYERRAWLVAAPQGQARYEVLEGAGAPRFADVAAALTAWAADGRPDAVIRILDSRTYALPASVTLDDTSRLAIEAESGERPLLTTAAAGLEVKAPGTNADPAVRGAFTLSGVVMEGFVHVTGDLAALRLIHATLVPGRTIEDGAAIPSPPLPSVTVEVGPALNRRFELQVVSSVTGPLQVPEPCRAITILDSIVDALADANGAIDAGAPIAPTTRLTIARSTVRGRTSARRLDASDVIFTGLVRIEQTQQGCVRFSYVPSASHTPRRHRCQPGLAPPELAGRMRPSFTTTRYGQPAYLQLRMAVPDGIRAGASDGSEMGAYSQLKQPQRESNLRTRLDEYLPFGLEAGPIYVT